MTAPGTGGFAQMDPDALEPLMRQIEQQGDELAVKWDRLKSDMAGSESGIGSGPLGAVFRQTYTAATESIRQVADLLPDRYLASARAGLTAVAEYRQADAAGAAAFSRPGLTAVTEYRPAGADALGG